MRSLKDYFKLEINAKSPDIWWFLGSLTKRESATNFSITVFVHKTLHHGINLFFDSILTESGGWGKKKSDGTTKHVELTIPVHASLGQNSG